MTEQRRLTDILQSTKKVSYAFTVNEVFKNQTNYQLLKLIEYYREMRKRNKHISVFLVACAYGSTDIVEELLQEGWDVNGVGPQPLWFALWSGNIPVVHKLIKNGANIHYGLMSAALTTGQDKGETKCIECAKILLSVGISVHAIIDSKCQQSAIHLAAQNNRNKLLRFVLRNGADVNAKDSQGYTALHLATLNNCLKSMKILIKHNADLYAGGSKDGETALFYAMAYNMKEAVKTLVEGGYDINKRSIEGMITPLHSAIGFLNVEMVELLLNLGADPNILGRPGRYPLMLVACRNKWKPLSADKKTLEARIKIATLLVEKGGNVNIMDGSNPLCTAICSKFYDLAKTLVILGANVNIIYEPTTHDILFHKVVLVNNDIIETFLQFGGDYSYHNNLNNTPYNLAISHKTDLKYIKCFIKFGCPYNQDLIVWSNLDIRLNRGTERFFEAERQFFKGLQYNNLTMVKSAVKDGAVVNGCSEEIMYPVHFLASKGYNKLLDFLLEKGVEPNMLNEQGESALYVAAKYGHYNCCCTLLKFGACYNYPLKSNSGDWVKNESVVNLLLSVHKMFTLTRTGHKKVITILSNLLSRNTNQYLVYANATNQRGDMLLATALCNNHIGIAQEMMKLRVKCM